MKIRVEENVYKGNTSYQLVPRKYNEDKEEGLKGKDILICKAKFDSKEGMATLKKDTKFKKAGDQFPWGFVKIEWVNMPSEYEQHLDDFGGISLSYGGISNIRGFNDRHIPKDSEFYIASVPFVAKDGSVKKSVTLEQITPITVKQYKMALAIQGTEKGYLDEVVIPTDDGQTETKKICDIIPFWAYCAPESILAQHTLPAEEQGTL